MTIKTVTIASALIASCMAAQAQIVGTLPTPQAVPPVTQGDLEAARQSFAIEAALEGCWLRTEEPVACGDKLSAEAKCISIKVKKVPCADEGKPAPKDSERGV